MKIIIATDGRRIIAEHISNYEMSGTRLEFWINNEYPLMGTDHIVEGKQEALITLVDGFMTNNNAPKLDLRKIEEAKPGTPPAAPPARRPEPKPIVAHDTDNDGFDDPFAE